MENKIIKTSRADETRAKAETKKFWSPPNSLDAPPAPTGYRHQWIRAEILGQSDAKNIAASLREGWELVRAKEYPDTHYPSETEASTLELSEWEAYCWLGYLKRLRFKSMLIIKSKTMQKKKQ